MRFQSPSLRGSGHFIAEYYNNGPKSLMFQSPSLRGSGHFLPKTPNVERRLHIVSIPFIAGQWSLRGDQRRNDDEHPSCFNPLHCGAVVASSKKPTRMPRRC